MAAVYGPTVAAVQDISEELMCMIGGWALKGVDRDSIRKLVMAELGVSFLLKEVKAKVLSVALYPKSVALLPSE